MKIIITLVLVFRVNYYNSGYIARSVHSTRLVFSNSCRRMQAIQGDLDIQILNPIL